MSDTNQFGPWVDGWYIEQLMEALLQKWLRSGLDEVERERGLDPGTIPNPKAWSHHNVFTKDMEDDTPAVIIVAPGLASKPTREGDGMYTAPFRLGVGVVCADLEEEWASETAKAYLAALRLVILKYRGLEDPRGLVQRTDWEDEKYDDIPAASASDRTLATAQTVWTVHVRGVATDPPGPTDVPAPTLEPGTDPGPWPTIDPSRISIGLEKKPISGS